jgi:DnaJ-class molecular chaperone
MKIVLRLIPNQHCDGCGGHGVYVEERNHICLNCLSLHVQVEQRKQKLQSTLTYRFAALKQRISEQLRAFTQS